MTDILYHYCHTPTAFNILQSQTIRLSPLSAANDSMEGRVFASAFRKIVATSRLPRSVAEIASIVIDGHANHMEGFAFCLSENGDLLSQWRAYADDGYGVALGFDKALLGGDHGSVFGRSFFELRKIIYGGDELRSKAQALVEELENEFSPHGEFVRLRAGIDVNDALALLADREADAAGIFKVSGGKLAIAESFLRKVTKVPWETFYNKSESFSEELEWRILRYRQRAGFPEIKFQADRKQIKPFIEWSFSESTKKAIFSLTLGPRNTSDLNWVRSFLADIGLPNVNVKKSAATSYR